MTASPGFGAALSWDPDGGTSYTAIGQVQDITYPTITRGDIEIVHHDLTANYKEYLPGLVDPGTLGFTVVWDPANANHVQGVGTGIIGDFEQDGCTLPTIQLVLDSCAGTATWTGEGYVNAFTLNAPTEDALTADISFKLSGKHALVVT